MVDGENPAVGYGLHGDPASQDANMPAAPKNKPPSPLNSPYQVLPPIGSADSQVYTDKCALSTSFFFVLKKADVISDR